jgi:hypothetical protein
MEESMNNEQIEEWIVDNTDFNLDEVHWMTSETPFQQVNHNYSPMSKDYTERDMENAFEAGEINRTPEGFQKMSSSAWVQQYTPEVIEG